jgi:GT2 family glycosyltransferase
VFSIVIPCYNDVDLLVEQLDGLADQTGPEAWEVVIADNGTTGGVEVVEAAALPYRARLPELRVLDASDRRGAAHARNVGVRVARGDKIGFLDADDVAADGWVAAMTAALDSHPVAASRWDVDRLNTEEVASGRRGSQTHGLRTYRHPPFLPHAGGCGLGVRREAFEQVGGFDEGLRLLEDTDLIWRLQLAGYELAFVSDAVVHIRFRESAAASFRQSFGYGRYNVLLYKRYRRHGMPRLTKRAGLYSLVALVTQLPRLFDRRRRAAYLRSVGFRLGRIRGSIEQRVWGI